MPKDYYKILGVEKNSGKDEIKKAFRKLAHKYHPDKKTGDEKKFKEVNEAYSVLSNDKKRAEYDTYGQTFAGGGPQPGAGGFSGSWQDFANAQGGGQGFEDFDIGDIFGEFFGGRSSARQKRGRDIAIDMELSFEDAVFGLERKVLLNKASKCDSCHGSGAKEGSKMVTCTTCNGHGRVREAKRSIFGTFETEHVCGICGGKGQEPESKCSTCKGTGVHKKQSEIKISIPSGIENGEMVRLSGQGEAVPGGVAGDLYIKVHVRTHKNIKKEGSNLIMDLNIKLSDALLGSTYTVKTLDGEISLKIPSGTKFGEMLRVKGKGVPFNNGQNRGDLLVRLKIELPQKISRTARKIIEELKKEGI